MTPTGKQRKEKTEFEPSDLCTVESHLEHGDGL